MVGMEKSIVAYFRGRVEKEPYGYEASRGTRNIVGIMENKFSRATINFDGFNTMGTYRIAYPIYRMSGNRAEGFEVRKVGGEMASRSAVKDKRRMDCLMGGRGKRRKGR